MMKKLIITILALLVAVSMLSAQSVEQATELARQAKAALDSRDYPAALSGFESALAQAEACGEEGQEIADICKRVIPQIHMQQGIALAEEEAWALAAEEFKAVLDADPENGEAALRYGIALDMDGREAEAVEAYKLAAENGQEQADALLKEHARIAEAQQVKIESGTHEYDFKVYFPFDVSKFSPDYLDNPVTLARLDSVISVHGLDAIDAFVVIAKSSPEGPYQYNMNLAERRAISMRNYLLERYPDLKDKVTMEHGVSPWPESKDKKALVRLRYAAFRMVFPFDITIPAPAPIDSSLFAVNLPGPVFDLNIPEPVVVSDKYKQMIFAIKTNLLYDAVTALNFEVEVPIADRYSIMWEDVFPWWETGNKYCFQHWEMGPEFRYWFKPWDPKGIAKLRGFFAGVYGMSAKYDFQYDRSLDYQGEYWSAGITGGWTKALGRTEWCNLELSLSLGYLSSRYRGYIPADDYSLLIRNPRDVGSIDYFGPTKAKISFVIPICINRSYKGGTK
ncbi:MAG: DUF3575 domain-containing protein [Bacteroidales bacterium]|nr:DUF3575 domain-containing protein [Bacteroidales bacterium]